LSEETDKCPKCGSNAKTIKIDICDPLDLHDDIHGKVKKEGQKKPSVEFKKGNEFYKENGEWRDRYRSFDHENDDYEETIIDKKTGKVIKQCKEPLSQHQGHGSAKKKDK
jgi:hypothetical protein